MNFCKVCRKMRKSLTKLFWNYEIWAVQRHVNLVDLVKSFPTHILLQNLASIQPITSPFKFARSPLTDPPGSMNSHAYGFFWSKIPIRFPFWKDGWTAWSQWRLRRFVRLYISSSRAGESSSANFSWVYLAAKIPKSVRQFSDRNIYEHITYVCYTYILIYTY